MSRLECEWALRERAQIVHENPDILVGLPARDASETGRGDALVAFKPDHFGGIGHLANNVVDMTVSKPLKERRHPMVGNPYQRFEIDIYRALTDSMHTIVKSMPGAQLRALQAAKDRVDEAQGRGREPLAEELTRGIGTASFTLNAVRRSLSLHAQELVEPENRKPVLLKSYGNIQEHMVQSVEQSVLSGWLLRNEKTPPITYNRNSRTLSYATPLKDSCITDEMRQYFRAETQKNTSAATIAEVAVHGPVIGCPIWLKPGQVKLLWQWAVAVAEDRKRSMPA